MRLRNRHCCIPRPDSDPWVYRIDVCIEQRYGADAALRRTRRHRRAVPEVQGMPRSCGVRFQQARKLEQLFRRNQLQFVLRKRGKRARDTENRGKDQSLHPDPLFQKLTSSGTAHLEQEAGQHPGLIQRSPDGPIVNTENGAPISCGSAHASTLTSDRACS
jgi:hypothetical protein